MRYTYVASMALIEFLFAHPLLFASACVWGIVFLKKWDEQESTLFLVGKWFIGLFLLYAAALSFFQYVLWARHPIMRFVLPPYGSIMYVLLYSYHIFFKQIIWRMIGAAAVLFAMEQLNRAKQQSLFYAHEIATVSFLTLLIDFPLNLIILPLGLLGILIMQVGNKTFREKISFQPYWKYAGGVLLFINFYLVAYNLHIILQP